MALRQQVLAVVAFGHLSMGRFWGRTEKEYALQRRTKALTTPLMAPAHFVASRDASEGAGMASGAWDPAGGAACANAVLPRPGQGQRPAPHRRGHRRVTRGPPPITPLGGWSPQMPTTASEAKGQPSSAPGCPHQNQSLNQKTTADHWGNESIKAPWHYNPTTTTPTLPQPPPSTHERQLATTRQ
jgi:hypothetical protein